MVNYSPHEEVSVERLRETDGMQFGLLCERAGYLNSAFETYVASLNPDLSKRALEMIDKSKIENVPEAVTQDLIKKLREHYIELSETIETGNIFTRHNACVSRQRGSEGLEWLNGVESRLQD